jgi:hypothetical protein
MPERIQRSRAKGWQMPDGAIYVGHPTVWGNPFDFRRSEFCWLALSFGCKGDRAGRLAACILAYRDWLTAPEGHVIASYERGISFGVGDDMIEIGPRLAVGQAPTLDAIRKALRGHDLACWCPLNAPCHADVLLEIANA